MKNLVLTIPFIKEIKHVRYVMVDNLIDLMKRHGVNEVDCSEVNACPPVIHVGICDDDVTRLDTIELVSGENYEYILLNGSSELSNGVVNASQMNIELLAEVHDWIKANEKELFEDVK